MATFRFAGLEDLKLQGFDHQNVIFGLLIQVVESAGPGKSKFHGEYDPSFGTDATFECRSIELGDVRPLLEMGSSG